MLKTMKLSEEGCKSRELSNRSKISAPSRLLKSTRSSSKTIEWVAVLERALKTRAPSARSTLWVAAGVEKGTPRVPREQ